MRMFEPLKCCCCMDIRTGTLVLGVLALIGSGITILSDVKELATGQQYEMMHIVLDPDQNPELCGHEVSKCEEVLKIFDQVYMPIIISTLVINIYYLVISSLLIHGVNKEKPQLMLPYLVTRVIELVLCFIALIVLMCFFPNPTVLLVVFLTMIIVSILPIYFFLVVRATYLQMRRQQGEIPVEFTDGKSLMMPA